MDWSAHNVAALLSTACSEVNALLREPALNQLLQYETHAPQQLAIALAAIATNPHLHDQNTRILALAFYRHSMPFIWIPRFNNQTIDNQTKILVRCALMDQYNKELDQRVLLQISALIAKIARYDWPHIWSTMFADLVQMIQSNDLVKVVRGLDLLNEILLELESKRLPADRKEFQAASHNLIGHVYQIWRNHVKLLLNAFASNSFDQNMMINLNLTELCSKCMQTLIIYGIPELDQSEDSKEFFSSVHEFLSILVPYGIKTLYHITGFKEKFEDLIDLIAEVVIQAEKTHRNAFRSYISSFLELFSSHLCSDTLFSTTGEIISEHYAVKCMEFVKESLNFRSRFKNSNIPLRITFRDIDKVNE
jgi:hypothetical protein